MASVQKIERVAKRDDNVLTVSPDTSITIAAGVMRKHHIGCLVVTNPGGTIAGIVTERDLLDKVVAAGLLGDNVTVAAVMSDNVVCCKMNTDIAEAERMMVGHNIRHMPIVENNRLIGMLSSRDVLAMQLTETRKELTRQSNFIAELEIKHPGITQLQRDNAGRINARRDNAGQCHLIDLNALMIQKMLVQQLLQKLEVLKEDKKRNGPGQRIVIPKNNHL